MRELPVQFAAAIDPNDTPAIRFSANRDVLPHPRFEADCIGLLAGVFIANEKLGISISLRLYDPRALLGILADQSCPGSFVQIEPKSHGEDLVRDGGTQLHPAASGSHMS